MCQKYFICVINERGNTSILKGMSVAACFVVGEIGELITQGYIIWNEKNRILIAKTFNDSLTYLKPIYEAIAYFKEPVDVMYIVDMYASHMRLIGNYRKASIKDLLYPIGNSLVTVGCATELLSKGLVQKETKYAPNPEIVTHTIEEIREAFMENDDISDQMLCLVALLEKSDFINNYFSKQETTLLEINMKIARKKVTKDSTKKILEYIDTIPRILSNLDWGGA